VARLVPATRAHLHQPQRPVTLNHRGPCQGRHVSTGQATPSLRQVKQEQAVRSPTSNEVGTGREERQAGGKTQQLLCWPRDRRSCAGALYESSSSGSFIFDHRSGWPCWERCLGLAGRGSSGHLRPGRMLCPGEVGAKWNPDREFANQTSGRKRCGPARSDRRGRISRLRPIVLTALTSLAGFLPLVFATGPRCQQG